MAVERGALGANLIGKVSLFAIALALAGQASAQESAVSPASDEQDEEIVVTGVRAAIQNQVNKKRDADQVVDGVTAEDIGKLPDQNVAEALQRVTGVQIERDFGEGSAIQVRGFKQNRIEVNGRTVSADGENRAASLNSLSSELYSAIEVKKSPIAEDIEGSLGATVNLRTREPLEERKDIISLGGRQSYADDADKFNPSASIFALTKFDTGIGEIGLAFNAAYSKLVLRQDSFAFRWGARTNLVDRNGNGRLNDPDDEVFIPLQFRNQLFVRDRERLGFTGVLQWRPSDEIDILIEGSDAQLKHETVSYLLLTRGQQINNPRDLVISDNDTVLSGRFGNAPFLQDGWSQPADGFTRSGSARATWKRDRFTLRGEVSRSEGGNDTFNTLVQSRSNCSVALCGRLLQNPEIIYDASADTDLPSLSLVRPNGAELNYTSLDNIVIDQILFQDVKRRNVEEAARLDFDYRVDNGFFNTFEFGYRHADSTASRRRRQLNDRTLQNEDPRDYPELIGRLPYNDFLGRLTGDTIRNFWTINANTASGQEQEFADRYGISLDFTPGSADLLQNYDISERTHAFYAMTRFSLDGGLPLRGNIGVRYVKTRLTSSGFLDPGDGTIGPVSIERSYENWLPSANLLFDITDKLKFRLSASRVIARPPLEDLSVGVRLSLGDLTGSRGNPFLDPLDQNQYDAIVEWYFSPGNLLNAGLFYKDVKTFITSGTILETFPQPGGGTAEYELRTPVNGKGGKVKGAEIGYSHAFNFLPGILSGFGIQATYTYIDSETPNRNVLTGAALPLEGLSKHSFNIVPYFEKYGISARVAYNWRSSFLESTAGFNNQPIYQKARGQLDASIGFDVTPQLTFQFEAINITQAYNESYAAIEERKQDFSTFERQFTFGVRAKF